MKTIQDLENSMDGVLFDKAMQELENIILDGGKIKW